MRKAKQVILDDKVDFIVVGTCSNVVTALHPIITEHKKILLNIGALSDNLQGQDFSRYAFRAIWNNWAQAGGLAEYYVRQPFTKFYLLNVDYVFGHDFAKAFIENLKKRNPKANIVGDEYFEVGIKDWGPHLSKIKASGAEVVLTTNRSSEIVTMMKQIDQLGIKVEVAASAGNVPSVLEAAGDSALGIVHVVGIINTDDTPSIRKTEELWHQMYKDHPDKDYRYPFALAMDHINGWNFFVAAVEKTRSFDPEKIISTWEGMHFTSLHGKDSYMRACDHQIILPMTVAKIVKGYNKYLGDKPYLGKPILYVPGEDAAIPATPKYNPRCK